MSRTQLVSAVAVLFLTSGCGGNREGTDLSIRIVSGYGRSGTDHLFTLRCEPTGGDMPHGEQLCRMIAKRPTTMLFPGPPRASCVGGMNIPPSVTVSGESHGRRVSFTARVMCEWPGGADALAFLAGAACPSELATAAARLPYDEEPEVEPPRFRWSRLEPCLRVLRG